MKEKLLLVTIKEEYINYLSNYDAKISKKSNRIWIGIVFEINSFKYFAPLSSPKEKHSEMKEQIDFLKIDDGILGVINFNNMIPLTDKILYEIIDIKNLKDLKYKILMEKQQRWLRKNKKNIYLKAENLYKKIEKILKKKKRNKMEIQLLKRCVNFKKLEKTISIDNEYNELLEKIYSLSIQETQEVDKDIDEKTNIIINESEFSE